MLCGNGPDKDLAVALAAKTQPTIANLQQARAAGLNDLKPAPGSKPELCQTTNPAGAAGYVVNFAPFAGAEEFEWHEWLHGLRALTLLRFSLSKG